MFKYPRKRFTKRSLRLGIVALFCSGFLLIFFFTGRTALVQDFDREPIAFVGHGGIFDHRGQEISPTLEFIRKAQEWYIADLNKKLAKNKQKDFSKFSKEFSKNLVLDDQSKLVLNSGLIDRLIEMANPENRARLQGKNNVLKWLLRKKLSNNPDIRAPRTEPFPVNNELRERLRTLSQPQISKSVRTFEYPRATDKQPGREVFTNSVWVNKQQNSTPDIFRYSAYDPGSGGSPDASASNPQPQLTNNGGQAYRDQCRAAGVPIPPDFGPGSPWVSQGTIPRNELFIVASLDAEVLTFDSSATSTPAGPRGMCIALPRYDTVDGRDIVELDGVICLGQTGNACFWDNEKFGTTTSFERGSAVSFEETFGGGTELFGDGNLGGGGVCSDCHSGENPYIIHGDVLEGLKDTQGLPTFAPGWHEPIVRTGDNVTWPENPGPMNIPATCSSCHGSAAARKFAGRLPHISTESRGYCGAVLRASVRARPLTDVFGNVVKNPVATMPQGDPGGLVCTPNLNEGDPGFIRACPSDGSMSASCNSAPLSKSDRFYVGCTPELSGLLSLCSVAPKGDASGRGDPHVTTFNGISYDFQGAGEFVYLRNGRDLEVQVRQSPIGTTGAILPNAYTGLSSCVSVITAIAIRAGGQRVTLQPASGGNLLEVRVDGVLRLLGQAGINLSNGARVTQLETGSGIGIDFPDKTRLIVTTNFWPSQKTWYMNVDVVNTQAREGIAGAITPASWLPLLPTGIPLGPMPQDEGVRFDVLNQTFAEAWRVTSATSLFDYAAGTSTATFTDRTWPPRDPAAACVVPGSTVPPAQPMGGQEAQERCSPITSRALKSQCLYDLMVTGEAGFAKTYQDTQTLLR